jgi:type II secretory pathway pseudopilin PulG
MTSARRSQRGYAMAALLVGLAVMGVLLSAAMPVWRTLARRDREAELVFRGEQYSRAIGLYQRKYANAYPASLDVLLKQRFLRKQYLDPMTTTRKAKGAFKLLYQNSLPQSPAQGTSTTTTPGTALATSIATSVSTSLASQQPAGPRGGIVGVASTSDEASLRTYNGKTRYSDWHFVWPPPKAGAGTRN